VKETDQDHSDVPVWAKADAFPVAPNGWGWVDLKGVSHPCTSLEALAAAIRDDRDGSVTLVWAPGHERMILPEELEGMGDALRTARTRWNRDDLEDSTRRLRWFGGILGVLSLYMFLGGFVLFGRLASQSGTEIDFLQRLKFAARAVLESTQCGLALLMFVIFAFIPWYQARKRSNELPKWTDAGMAEVVPTIRFETWLDRQKAPVTRIFLGVITLVALAQILGHVRTQGLGSLWSLIGTWDGITAAGLVKERYFQGEWWRLFTAPLLHGNLLHFLMNAAALAYLGKRLEVFARWPHLPLVFLFAASVGGEASARFVAAPSVGASGGLMGWLGFLMVFETLHKQLVPRRARRRLAAGVVLTALIGLFGYRFIDNAAHAGGLIAGMIYAAIVFPASSSPNRPQSTVIDRIAGSAALAVLAATALFAAWKISSGG
jgi:membrane associated rhomboid family serine protease